MSIGSVNIVREGLVLCLDGENIKSYPVSGDNWYDLTSNYNNGVLTNGATFSPSGNGSIEFDGINDYVEFGDILDLGTNSLTINMWMDLNSKDTLPIFLSKSFASVGNYRYSVGIDYYGSGGLAAFMIGDTGPGTDIYAVGTTDVPLNTWFMCTFVFDRNSDIKIYYNGVLENLTFPQGGDATISQWLGQDFQSNNPFRIGCYTAADNITPNYFMNGKISTSQVYFRALTPSEVLQNYNSIKWRFMNDVLPSIVTDQLVLNLDPSDPSSYPGSGTNWYDLTAYNNDGVLTNGVVYNNSLYGGGMDFDGVNDYVTIPSSTSLNPTHTITLCAWVNHNGVYSGYSAPIVFKRNTQMNYFEQYIIGFSTSGKISIALGDDANTNDYTETSSSYINQLINVVGIIDTLNSVIKIYINGVLESSKVISYPNMYISTNPVIIGSYNEPSFNGFMGGGIYNVLIYGKVLSEEEILQNYNVQKSRYGL